MIGYNRVYADQLCQRCEYDADNRVVKAVTANDGLIWQREAWLCGDLYLENFGSFRGGNKIVYFDMDDFDKAILVPLVWELSRFINSILLAFEILKFDNKKAFSPN